MSRSESEPAPCALVTGASGFLGRRLTRDLLARGLRVVGTSRDGSGMAPGVEGLALGLEDGGQRAQELLAQGGPAGSFEQVYHLAAMSGVGACERDPSAARAVNAEASGALAAAAARAGARFVFSSTDLVHDGQRAPYSEGDAPTPWGAYADSKAEAERLVAEANPAALIARVSLLYGRGEGRARGGFFFSSLLGGLRRGAGASAFSDEFRAPLWVGDAARLLIELVHGPARGLVNVAGPERVSRLEHARALAQAAGLDPQLVAGQRVADVFGAESGRPPDCTLRIDRLLSLVERGPLGVVAGARAAFATGA